MKDRSHDEAMAELFQRDPSYVIELIADVRRGGDGDELAVVFRQLNTHVDLKSVASSSLDPRE